MLWWSCTVISWSDRAAVTIAVDFAQNRLYNQGKQLVKQMWFAPHLQKNGGDAMKNFKDMLILMFTFGIFLMALLTFIFNFR